MCAQFLISALCGQQKAIQMMNLISFVNVPGRLKVLHEIFQNHEEVYNSFVNQSNTGRGKFHSSVSVFQTNYRNDSVLMNTSWETAL